MDCNQDIADSIVDTVVAVDTIALQQAQPPALQLGAETLSWVAGWYLFQVEVQLQFVSELEKQSILPEWQPGSDHQQQLSQQLQHHEHPQAVMLEAGRPIVQQ